MIDKLLVGGIALLTGAVAVGGVIIIGAIIGSVIGALCGEILDHVPYLNNAIPEGLGYLGSCISGENTETEVEALKGNLDKLGAALGFIGGFFKSTFEVSKSD